MLRTLEETLESVRSHKYWNMSMPDTTGCWKEIVTSNVRLVICSNCGKHMVVKQNSKTGVFFLGCSDFPICMNTKRIIRERPSVTVNLNKEDFQK